ncbi:nucleoside 2-deoxyribosyltransferase domain-containing protein [Leptothoe spongobia]|uniref:Nucleoside 2-deoxyribosyltransferase domain-containing protein n=1 Tax=Leptothoe spongobia TAU-MAC 1115 TaxID=1967444 RepID=A0A947DHB3_9CYAN|nr:nucleoside 2-deoxyribosyltransferase domain-containing protein [Leptothoe spongobia]MBT9317063.1 nucleoside 2-deoxyribosyltransferase domain-containing protein [Leptothoe spongobia TAU-MAC 1115]
MVHVIKPPQPLSLVSDYQRTVFLAGSIEMGTAENWQDYVAQSLQPKDLTLLNPRRDAWDPCWQQTITNLQFRGQVEWELEAQENAAMIAMYFSPSTQSPITLLELGLFASSGRLVVCCPDGFWRKGNVEVVCDRYTIPIVSSLNDLIASIQQRFP